MKRWAMEIRFGECQDPNCSLTLPKPYYVKRCGRCQRKIGQTSKHGLGGQTPKPENLNPQTLNRKALLHFSLNPNGFLVHLLRHSLPSLLPSHVFFFALLLVACCLLLVACCLFFFCFFFFFFFFSFLFFPILSSLSRPLLFFRVREFQFLLGKICVAHSVTHSFTLSLWLHFVD